MFIDVENQNVAKCVSMVEEGFIMSEAFMRFF